MTCLVPESLASYTGLATVTHKTLVSETGWNFNCTLCILYVVKVIYIYVRNILNIRASLFVVRNPSSEPPTSAYEYANNMQT